MEFRLTYQGPLPATQREQERKPNDPRPDIKHAMRKEFHKQLKRLWQVHPALSRGGEKGPSPIVVGPIDDSASLDATVIAARHALFGFNFVPLVRPELDLLCGLEILFLRADKPGNLWKGDIDNRIKILLDALALPIPQENYVMRTPEEDEKPFYCLLANDNIISKLSIETDELLEFVTGQDKLDDVRLVITVRLRPYELHLNNMPLG